MCQLCRLLQNEWYCVETLDLTRKTLHSEMQDNSGNADMCEPMQCDIFTWSVTSIIGSPRVSSGRSPLGCAGRAKPFLGLYSRHLLLPSV